MAKTYNQTYIYTQYPDYEKKMFEFVMNAKRIDTKSEQFADILYDVKRRKISDSLVKIMQSRNVVIGIANEGLPKAFKAFTFKDVKEDKNATKVFIDATGCIIEKNGQYVCNNLTWLISYVISAMTNFVYTMAENKIVGNASVLKDGGEAFTRCFSYVIDRMYKISTIRQLKQRIEYAIAIYYQVNILGKDFMKSYDTIKANAIRISGVEPRDAQIVDVMLDDEHFVNLETFISGLNKMFDLRDLNPSNVISMWMNAFGTGTVFALEYFPAFATMMTNTYMGGYIDQQQTIEKIAGTALVSFTKTILQIGAAA